MKLRGPCGCCAMFMFTQHGLKGGWAVISLPGALLPWLLAWGGMGHSEWNQCGDRKSKHLYVGLPGLGVGVGKGSRSDQPLHYPLLAFLDP